MPRNPNKTDYSGGFPEGFEHFNVVEDPRTGGNKKHHFGEIIFIAVSALLCGVNSFSGMVEFAYLKEDWLKKWIKLANGIPRAQTILNLFAIIDSEQFGDCVIAHIAKLHPEMAKQLIAVDGKTLRGSGTSKLDQEHCVSAWASQTGVTMALEFVQKKSNEITAIPKMLDKIEIKGCVLSVDAMGTQRAIAKKIVDKEADYLMALKRNQGSLHDEVIDQFHFATTQIKKEKSDAWSIDQDINKANGRVCKRRVAVTNQLDWMRPSIRNRWAKLTSLIMVETETYSLKTKKTVTQKRFYISSLDNSAAELNQYIRQHWSIENGCHWVLDTLFREDHSQVRINQAAQNYGILRRIVLNVLKSDQSIKKSLPMKQLHAIHKDVYREKLLSLA